MLIFRVMAVVCLLVSFASAQLPRPGGVGGGGGSVGTPHETTGTGTSVSISAATHGKGTKPIWTSTSCFATATGATLTAFAPVVNPTTGDVSATWTGSTAYTCRVFASGQAGTNGTNGTNGEVLSNAGTYADGQFVVSSGTTGDAIKPLTGTGVVKMTNGVPSVVTGTASDCVKVDGTSGTCGSGGSGTIPITSSVLKGDGAGNATAATSGTDYAPATSGTSILKGNGSGGFSAASAGTDYQAADGDLTAIAALFTNGFPSRSGANTWNQRTHTGTTNEITITNGDGASGNPTYALASTFDISGKTSTKPSKTGTSLPLTCGQGETYIKTDATAASQFYVCTSTNTWTAQGGGVSGNGVSYPKDFTSSQYWVFPYSASPVSGTSHGIASCDFSSRITIGGYDTTPVRTYCRAASGSETIYGQTVAQYDLYVEWSSAQSGRVALTVGGGVGGGSGITSMTTGASDPVAACTAPSSSVLQLYTQTTTQDIWACVATNTWKKILSTTNTGGYVATGATGTAPSTPSAGNVSCYFDSTTKTQICIDDVGDMSTTVRGMTAITNQFLTNITSAGVQVRAQPAFSDLSGTIADAQIASKHKTREFVIPWNAIDNTAFNATNDDQNLIWKNGLGSGITITKVACRTTAGTVSIQLQRDDGTPASILSSALACSTTDASTSSFVSGENLLSDGHYVNLDISSPSGSKYVAITVTYTVD